MKRFRTPRGLMVGLVTLVLLGIFGFVLIVPAFVPSVHFDQGMTTTLQTLTVAAVMYHIGTTASSARKDRTIAAQAAAAGQALGSTDQVTP